MNLPAAPAVARLRRFIFVLLLLGMAAAAIELVLLEHTESWQQYVPLVALALGFIACGAVAVRASRVTLLLLRACMLLFVAAGVVGIYLHYTGNSEFELEMYPRMKGRELIWNSLKGATPVGAPGYLAQLGLLGLIYTYRHPRLGSRGATPHEETEAS